MDHILRNTELIYLIEKKTLTPESLSDPSAQVSGYSVLCFLVLFIVTVLFIL